MFSLRATRVRMGDVTDGTSNTIFVGEAKRGSTNNHFQWTDPWSVISTNQGLNTPGYATQYYNNRFSSYHVGGAQFLLVDGSVRFISENIDLRLFGHLGTKSGGEPLGEF